MKIKTIPGGWVYSDLCVHIVWSVQVLTPTMTKCVGGEGGGGKEITDSYCGG